MIMALYLFQKIPWQVHIKPFQPFQPPLDLRTYPQAQFLSGFLDF